MWISIDEDLPPAGVEVRARYKQNGESFLTHLIWESFFDPNPYGDLHGRGWGWYWADEGNYQEWWRGE